MNHTEQAIREAQKAGYESDYQFHQGDLPVNIYREQKRWRNIALLDPSFWEALGKARNRVGIRVPINYKNWSMWQWHRFIDHLAEGKDIESFFAELL